MIRSITRPLATASLAVAAMAIGVVPGRAGADEGDAATPPSHSTSSVVLGARVAAPCAPYVPGRRIDSRLDTRVGTRIGANGRTIAVPVSLGGGPIPSKSIPYRVEPNIDGRPANPWDLPPEVPDERDFEPVDTFDVLASPHYEIREEIWSNPEDLVTRTGFSRYGGIAYVPFWGRNTIRWGRFSFVPFAHVEGVWHSSVGEGANRKESVFEVFASTGALGEYWFRDGKTKIKMSARADYRWYDDVYDPAYTYVGGAAIESRVTADHTIEVGGEAERARRAFDLDTTLGEDENIFERQTVFANGRWDRFLSQDLRLEVGGSYSWIDEIDSDVNGGDYTELDAFARLGWAIMRHESFAYGEVRYEERDADEDSLSSDLDHAYEARVGVNGILPHARTRRLVGNAYVGYRWEEYTPSTAAASVGAGRDTEAEILTFGGDLTYRPTPYTSGYLSFQRTNTFSAVANWNTVDTATLAVTQNLSRRLVGRVGVSASRVAPQDRSDSWRASAGIGVRWVVSDNVDATADYEYTRRFEGAGFDDAEGHRVALGLTFHMR